MGVAVILHEASRTGAPRVGGLIAAGLQKHLDVRIVCLSDGPIVPWLTERIGADNVRVIDFANQRHRVPFEERIGIAEQALAEIPCELVYVNSTAAAEFVFAAKAADKTAVLNVHENAQMMRRLFEIDLAKREVLSLCDGVVLAAAGQRRDLTEVFGFVPEHVLDFGIAVDAAEIERLAQTDDAAAWNAAGETIRWGERLCVGMCGHASLRKGADIFFEAAAALPQIDFLWVGNWHLADAPENPVYQRFAAEKLANFYITGGVDNPYRYFRRFDLLFLSSRDESNPLVVAEVMMLGVPVLAFSKTTAVADFLGRSTILCHGTPNLGAAVRVLRALDPGEIRSAEFRDLARAHRGRYDLAEKIPELVRFLGSL